MANHQATMNFIRRNGGVFYANVKRSSPFSPSELAIVECAFYHRNTHPSIWRKAYSRMAFSPSELSILEYPSHLIGGWPLDNTQDILFTPHQVSDETSNVFCAEIRHGRSSCGIQVMPDCHCTCLPVEAIRMGTGVPIQMGRLTDGTLGESSNFDGPILRSVHPGLAHLVPWNERRWGRLERMEMEAEWDSNQARLEELTKLGYLEYTLGPQCAVCAARQ